MLYDSHAKKLIERRIFLLDNIMLSILIILIAPVSAVLIRFAVVRKRLPKLAASIVTCVVFGAIMATLASNNIMPGGLGVLIVLLSTYMILRKKGYEDYNS